MARKRSRLDSLFALAGEIAGVRATQDAGVIARWRLLSGRDGARHPLFDPAYYTRRDGGARTGLWPPFLHYLLWGGFEGLKPHPLFDSQYYLTRYPDVAAAGLNPLQHYVRFGWREARSPHPLFDPAWYTSRYPEAAECGYDPLLHFLQIGGLAGLKPHPLFESGWYLRTYPEARQTGNPLVHYLTRGAEDGANPSPRFDSRLYVERNRGVAVSGLDPLSHLVIDSPRRRAARQGLVQETQNEALLLGHGARGAAPPGHGARGTAPARVWRNSAEGKDCAVFIVYGESHVDFVESQMLPSLAAQQGGSFRLHVHTLHYRNQECLLSPAALAFCGGAVEGVTDWSNGRTGGHIGFGESVNYLFERVQPERCFLLINPDSLPMPGCIGQLLATFAAKSAALVEARQWPMEHPKEFDPETGETPWASGAFVLISSPAFRKLGGFDPLYFLYNEDVDLSWRAWMEGMPVVYEPAAMCAHFTGILSSDVRRIRREEFFSLRNFLLIAYKFFGESGENLARDLIRATALQESLIESLEESYLSVRNTVRPIDIRSARHPEKIKILGINLFHSLRRG